jgi:hypothetical protein
MACENCIDCNNRVVKDGPVQPVAIFCDLSADPDCPNQTTDAEIIFDATCSPMWAVTILCDGVPQGATSYFDFTGVAVIPAMPLRTDCLPGRDYEQLCDDSDPQVYFIGVWDNETTPPTLEYFVPMSDGTLAPYVPVGSIRACASGNVVTVEQACIFSEASGLLIDTVEILKVIAPSTGDIVRVRIFSLDANTEYTLPLPPEQRLGPCDPSALCTPDPALSLEAECGAFEEVDRDIIALPDAVIIDDPNVDALCQPGGTWSHDAEAPTPPFPLRESFRTNTFNDPNWTTYDAAHLTSGVEDTAGQGWMQLTTNAPGQRGAIINATPFPTANANFVAEWTAAVRNPGGGGPGDGFGVIFLDGNQPMPPNLGGGAGAFSYTPHCGRGEPGIRYGVFEVAFDIWGGHGTGPANGPGSGCASEVPRSVVIRGSGDGVAPCDPDPNAYPCLGTTPMPFDLATHGRGNPARIRVSFVTENGQSLLSVQMAETVDSEFITVVDRQDVSADIALPSNLRIGFVGASGGALQEFHEIRDLAVAEAGKQYWRGLSITQDDVPPCATNVRVGASVDVEITEDTQTTQGGNNEPEHHLMAVNVVTGEVYDMAIINSAPVKVGDNITLSVDTGPIPIADLPNVRIYFGAEVTDVFGSYGTLWENLQVNASALGCPPRQVRTMPISAPCPIPVIIVGDSTSGEGGGAAATVFNAAPTVAISPICADDAPALRREIRNVDGTTEVDFLGANGGSITPGTWQSGPCPTSQLELVPACFIVNADPLTIHSGFAVVQMLPDSATTQFYYEADTGVVHQLADVTVVECVSEMDPVILCDQTPTGIVQFARHYLYGSYGNISGARDTALDGVTPYIPVGTVGVCNPQQTGTECFLASGAGADCDTATLDRVLWSDAPSWQAGNPSIAQINAALVPTGSIAVENTQQTGIQTTLEVTASTGLNEILYSGAAESMQLRIAGGGNATLNHTFDRAVCARMSTGVFAGLPQVWTSDQPITVEHNTSDPSIQGSAPIIVGNGTTSVTVTSNDFSRVIISTSNATNLQLQLTNNQVGETISPFGLLLGVPTGGNTATYRVVTYADGTQAITNVDDPNDTPAAVDPSWTRIPCNDQSVDVESHKFCDSNGPFLRWYIYDQDGVLLRTRDTDLPGALYTPQGTVEDCASGCENTVTRDILCEYDGLTGSVIGPPVSVVTVYDCDGLQISQSIFDFNGDPYVPTGILGSCGETEVEQVVLCDANGSFIRNILYNAAGTPTSTIDTELDGVTPYVVSGVVETCVPEDVRDTEVFTLCDDNGPFLRRVIYATDGTPQSATDTLLDGITAYVTVGTVTVCQPTDELDTEVFTLCDDNGPFLRRIVYAVTGLPSTVVDTLLDGITPYATVGTVGSCEPPVGLDTELLTLCDDNGPFLRRIVYGPDGLPQTITDTLLDAVTPYVVVGVAGPCEPDEPVGAEVLVLCDDDGPFLRHIRYNELGSPVSIVDTTLDGVTSYAPVGTVIRCTDCCPAVIGEGCWNDGATSGTFTSIRESDGTVTLYNQVDGAVVDPADVVSCVAQISPTIQRQLGAGAINIAAGARAVTVAVRAGTASVVLGTDPAVVLLPGESFSWGVDAAGESLSKAVAVSGAAGSDFVVTSTRAV